MTDEQQNDRSDMRSLNRIVLASRIISAYLTRNHVPAAEIPPFITSVMATLTGLANGAVEDTRKPAVSIKKSVGDDFIVCLEDGKRLTMLKRYLKTHHDMTPEQYRAKWNLPADYPMVAPAYARLRSAFAKRIGLGTKPGARSRRRPKK